MNEAIPWARYCIKCQDLLERGLVVNVPRPDTIRLLPPLIVDAAQIERAVGLIGEAL